MKKKAIVYVDCCRECPFSDSVSATKRQVWCNHLELLVDADEIHKDCPLEGA
jgi:hypothetical protein